MINTKCVSTIADSYFEVVVSSFLVAKIKIVLYYCKKSNFLISTKETKNISKSVDCISPESYDYNLICF